MVSATVNPAMVIQLREETRNPLVPPRTVTEAPSAALKTIGCCAVPERGTVTCSA